MNMPPPQPSALATAPLADSAPTIAGARVYRVGGAVRDYLLGLPIQDEDWVVVGATPQQMLEQGFLLVGKDFPVFLHPQTRQEYALARTERKIAPGYTGFQVYTAADVTLEQDLARRDLTINAIAQSPDGQLHDPYHGRRDLRDKVLRHVTEAFAEDPVRILRVARFAARFPDFAVAPETMQLMRQMVAASEVEHLVPERVWQEISRGLMQPQPSRMLQVLRDCGALARILPEVEALFGVPQRADYHPEVDTGIHLLMVLDMAARLQAPLAVRYACLCHDLGKAATPAHVLPRHLGHEQRSVPLQQALANRLRVPNDCRQLAHIVAGEHGNIHRSTSFSAAAVVRLLERCDAFRQPERFAHALLACECDARGRLGFEENAYPQRPHLLQALQTLQGMDVGVIAREVLREQQPELVGSAVTDKVPPVNMGERIRRRIHQARVKQLQAAWQCLQQAPAGF